MKKIFKYLLPLFMFKWNAEIKMTPDLDDIKSFCTLNDKDSFLLSSFKNMVKFLDLADLSEAAKLNGQ